MVLVGRVFQVWKRPVVLVVQPMIVICLLVDLEILVGHFFSKFCMIGMFWWSITS